MTSAVCRLKALRGKPKAKHIESELLSAVVRTAPPAGCRSPVGERGRNTDFTGWPSNEGQTGSQHALEGKTMNQDQAYLLSQPYCFQMGFQDFRGGEQFDSRRNAEWQRGWRWANAKSVSRSK
ncbi:hypothetical protein CD799_16625 [Pseudomonas aeruginosa]|nr:hypothetical protein CD799_16625 [Pseudomonas aeruginosa]